MPIHDDLTVQSMWDKRRHATHIVSNLTFDAGVLNLTRSDGRDSRRVHSRAGWHLPYTARYGYLVELGATLEADGYWVDEVDPDSPLVDPAET